jgi:hypothetical protein
MYTFTEIPLGFVLEKRGVLKAQETASFAQDKWTDLLIVLEQEHPIRTLMKLLLLSVEILGFLSLTARVAGIAISTYSIFEAFRDVSCIQAHIWALC